jgi:DNA polymerase elongation subunit (family B)
MYISHMMSETKLESVDNTQDDDAFFGSHDCGGSSSSTSHINQNDVDQNDVDQNDVEDDEQLSFQMIGNKNAPAEAPSALEKLEDSKRVNISPIKNPCEKVAALMGKSITLADLDTLPVNADFLDKKVMPLVEKTINDNKDIVFHSIKMWTSQWSEPGQWGFKFRFLWRGCGEDGRSMLLIVDDVFPTFYIRAPDGMEKNQFAAAVKHETKEWKQPREIDIVMRKRLVYYEFDLHPYARVFFNTMKDYEAAKEHFKEVKQWRIAEMSYTKSRFYLQACRQHEFNPASINTFKFKRRGNPYPENIVNDIDEVFVVSVDDIIPLNLEDIEEPRMTLVIPRITNLNFDIETGSATRGQALKAERDDTHSNVVSLTLRQDGEDLFRVSLTTSPHAEPKDGFVLIICDNEIAMFLIMANIIRKLRPEIISGYNIDDFDWRFIVTKLIRHEMVEPFFAAIDMLITDHTWWKNKNSAFGERKYNEFIARRYMNNTFMKISAEEMRCPIYYPNMVSFLNIDIFTQLKRKFPSGKFSPKSLNFFLQKVGLAPKFDMPVFRLFDIYEDQIAIVNGKDVKDMDDYINGITDVNVYCVFDTIAALDLMDQSRILSDLTISSVQNVCTLHDATFYAKGGIVMDKMATSAYRAGFLDSNEPINAEQRGTYPGALVLHPPFRGISKPKMSVKERRAHLPIWSSVTDEEAQIMHDAMYECYENPIEYEKINKICDISRDLFDKFATESTKTPTLSFDYGSMYPFIMMENNLSLEKCVKPEDVEEAKRRGLDLHEVDRQFGPMHIQAYFVKSLGGPETRGLIPTEQWMLREKRNVKKKLLKIAKEKLKDMDEEKAPRAYALQRVVKEKLDAEQLECKISMNTYYGKMGDRNNRYFMMAIACDTTFGGRERLREMIAILESHGWTIRYGDTDSAYADPPTRLFNDIHREYYGKRVDKHEYFQRMIARAHELGDAMEKTINETLKKNGHDFMYVEKERVSFPFMNIRPKRYVCGNHEVKSTLKEDGTMDMYLRGCGGRKAKSSSKLFLELSQLNLDALLNIYNVRSAKDIATDIIMEAYRKARDNKWPMDMFVQRAQFKPEKNNIRVISFRDRLIARGDNAPRAYEKFEYVYVRRDDMEYNEFGNKRKMNGSDFMELYTTATEKDLPINFTKYMTGEICGELGQFMCCDADFIVQPVNDTDDAMAEAEDKTQSIGKKFIMMLCNKASGLLSTSVTKPIFTKIRSHIDSHVLRSVLGPANMTKKHMKMITTAQKKDGSYTMFLETIAKNSTKGAVVIATAMIKKLDKGTGINPILKFHTQMSENSPFAPKEIYIKAISARKQQTLTRLHESSKTIDAFISWYANYVKKLDGEARSSLGLDKPILSIEDIKSAANKINSCLDDIKTDDADIIDVEIFDNCLQLVDTLIVFDRQIKAYDMFRVHIANRVEQFGKSGITINPSDIASDIAEAVNVVTMPDLVHEM